MKILLGVSAVLILVAGFFTYNVFFNKNKLVEAPVLEEKTTNSTTPGTQNTEAHFASGKYELKSESDKEGWVRDGWELTVVPRAGVIDFTGWSLHSKISGASFTFGKVTPIGTSETINIVLDSSQEGALLIHTAKNKKAYTGGGNEYHVFLGENPAWNRESDTIELISPDGRIVDTYSY